MYRALIGLVMLLLATSTCALAHTSRNVRFPNPPVNPSRNRFPILRFHYYRSHSLSNTVTVAIPALLANPQSHEPLKAEKFETHLNFASQSLYAP